MHFISTLLFFMLVAFTGCQFEVTETEQPPSTKSETKESNHAKIFTEIDSLLNRAINDDRIPGAVVLLRRGHKTIYSESFGHAMRFEYGRSELTNPEKLTTNHRFDLASLTKVFATTMGIMMLVQEEKIALDVPIKKYIRQFSGGSKDSVTIRNLLTHTGGLHEWKPIYYHANNPIDARNYICQLPLKYAVGANRHYSDLGFMLLGYVIEKVSDKSIQNYLQTKLFHPLGLSNTDFNPKGSTPPFAATSHGNPFERKMVSDSTFGFVCDEDPESFQDWRNYTVHGEVNDGNAFYAHQGVAGHAGLFSTAADLAVLVELLLNKGAHKGKKLIKESIIDKFLVKDKFGQGLGWAMSPGALPVNLIPEGSFGHTGFTGTFAVAIPKYQASLILLTNRQNMGVQSDGKYHSVNDLRKKITDLFISELKKENL